MRINEKSGARGIAKKGKGAPAKTAAVPSAPRFAGSLAQIASSKSVYAGDLKKLKDEIDKAGDALEREPTIVNYKAFRELLGAMARKVSAEAYRVELLSGGISGRSHEVISVIDKEADLLYHLVMREQKDHIRITAQIVKIKGLVVDFLL